MARTSMIGALLIGTLGLFAIGCGEGSPAGSSTTTGGETSTETGTGATAPIAPVLDDVMAMNGSLHVSWTVNGSCDAIEAERKTDMDDWAVAFSVAGTEKSHVDDKATADMTYTYKLRCKKGDEYSGYSNEKSANPKKM